MERNEINQPAPPTPSPTPSGSSGSSSEVVDAEWVEVEGAEKQREPKRAPAPLAVARVARGSGSRGRPTRPRSSPVLARARCVVCAGPAVSTARLFSVAHVPLCQRCGTVGALALRLLGGA
jgi:hypothetical protein